MPISAKLRSASTVMAWLSLFGAALYVTGDSAVFLAPETSRGLGLFELHHTGFTITPAMPLFFRLAAFAVELIPTALAVWALVALFRLFSLYAAGSVFGTAALSCLNRVTSLMFWFVLASFLAQAPISFILSESGVVPREISLTFSSHDAVVLFVAGVAVVIARVMAEAQRIADENAKFV